MASGYRSTRRHSACKQFRVLGTQSGFLDARRKSVPNRGKREPDANLQNIEGLTMTTLAHIADTNAIASALTTTWLTVYIGEEDGDRVWIGWCPEGQEFELLDELSALANSDDLWILATADATYLDYVKTIGRHAHSYIASGWHRATDELKADIQQINDSFDYDDAEEFVESMQPVLEAPRLS